MFRELAEELTGLFQRGVDAPLDDAAFDEWAGRIFRHQFEHNPIYAGFCRGRGVDPEAGVHWTEMPPVPTRAFKHLPLVSGSVNEVDAVFRTSGTTRGSGRRGEHRVRDLTLYRESLLPNFRAHLLPDDAHPRLLSLIPSPERAPHSSLSHMIGVVGGELELDGAWFMDPKEGLDAPGFQRALARAEDEGRSVLITATAFALVHWLDAAERDGWRLRLPEGSRIMETGGFKGRSRMVEKADLYDALERRLGISDGWIVNEYGMTELLSQFYEPTLKEARDGGRARRIEDRRLVGPPWVRTRVVDPVTLESVAPGEEGLLLHVDLANLGSVSAVLTEDLGVEADDGFRVLGRATDAEPRGCSLAMDELLTAADRP